MSALGSTVRTHAGACEGGRVLVADDDDALTRAFSRILSDAGHQVSVASDGREAADMLRGGSFDAIVSDLRMPRLGGIELLRLIRERDLDLPVIIVAAVPDMATAIEAIEYGAYRYIPKPVLTHDLRASVQAAVGVRRMARLKREALDLLGQAPAAGAERAGLEAALGRALDALWIAYQPIVRPSRREVFGYEVLLRTSEPAFPEARDVVEAAERLGRLPELGARVRALAGASTPDWDRGVLFLNVHPRELDDEALFSAKSPIAHMATNVVLEITERAALEGLTDVRERVARLRQLGFRLAVDDLGAGYAGLTSFATLEPEVVKFDLTLVRGVDTSDVKRRIIEKMTSLARTMGILVVAEGVETEAERSALDSVGCELMQGYLFGKPAAGFPEVNF